MKKRRLTLVAFMLVAVMVLGIGYAALTTYLDVTGTATVTVEGASSAFSEDVKFTDVVDAETNAAIVASKGTASIGDGKSADFALSGLKGAGDSITLIYTVTNAGDVDATIDIDVASCTNSASDYFDLTYVWADNTQDTQSLGRGASVKVHVTVTLKQTPTGDTATVGSFFVRLKATSTATSAE